LREYKLLTEIEHNFLILRKYNLLILRKYRLPTLKEHRLLILRECRLFMFRMDMFAMVPDSRINSWVFQGYFLPTEININQYYESDPLSAEVATRYVNT
jgi:hypothetical protein